MSMKKGQAAMEYLMTYGWAILVIVIVLAALLYLGVFNLRTPELCQLQVGTTCSSVKLVYNTGAFNFTLTNGLQKQIIVSAAGCSNNPNMNLSTAHALAADSISMTDIADVTIDVGSAKSVAGFNCYNSDGSTANGSIGADYRGKLYLRYAFSDDASNYRIIIGDVATKLQP